MIDDQILNELRELKELFAIQDKRIKECESWWQEVLGRQGTFPDLGTLLKWLSGEILDLRIENARLRSVLESIKASTKCGQGPNCWYGEYGRHSPECTWAISEEADAALSQKDDDK